MTQTIISYQEKAVSVSRFYPRWQNTVKLFNSSLIFLMLTCSVTDDSEEWSGDDDEPPSGSPSTQAVLWVNAQLCSIFGFYCLFLLRTRVKVINLLLTVFFGALFSCRGHTRTFSMPDVGKTSQLRQHHSQLCSSPVSSCEKTSLGRSLIVYWKHTLNKA